MNEVVVFQVPELARHPLMGGGCCAVSSEWLIRDGISQLSGVAEVQADGRSGQVSVSFDPRITDIDRIAEALQGLSFRPVAIIRVKQLYRC